MDPIWHMVLTDFVSGDDTFHLARVTHSARNRLALHDHGFPEVIWVEQGHGYHLINGETVSLEPGTIIFIRPRPADTHTVRPKNWQETLTMGVVAFFTDTLQYHRARYFPDSTNYFWSEELLPHHLQVDTYTLNWLSDSLNELMRGPRSHRRLDQFLLTLFQMLDKTRKPSSRPGAPSWLTDALAHFDTPAFLAEGAQGFATLANRTPEHINRTVKKHYGLTLSGLINRERMAYAARQLVLTDAPISSIAYESGFENLGYFYTVFKKHFKTSPGRYRTFNKRIG